MCPRLLVTVNFFFKKKFTVGDSKMDPVAEAAATTSAINLIANGMDAAIAIKHKCKLPYTSRDSRYRKIIIAARKIQEERSVKNFHRYWHGIFACL